MLSGSEEGLLGWVALNYASGALQVGLGQGEAWWCTASTMPVGGDGMVLAVWHGACWYVDKLYTGRIHKDALQ